MDSQFTHLAWIRTPRNKGGLGPLTIPLLSDLTHKISKDYGVFLEDAGHTLRFVFLYVLSIVIDIDSLIYVI